MSFVQPGKNTARSTAGIGVAIVFHVVLLWALMSGLGRQVMQVINAPIETKIIEEVKAPPPPPKVIEMPPPPKFAPPPAFVPPPEVQMQASPPPEPTITATVAEPPAIVPAVTPRAEVAPAPAPAPAPAQAPVSASVACSNYAKVMGDAGFPRDAIRAGLDEGSAVVQFTLSANGEVKDIKVVRASHPAFAKGSTRIVSEYKCKGQGRDVTVEVPFVFKSG